MTERCRLDVMGPSSGEYRQMMDDLLIAAPKHTPKSIDILYAQELQSRDPEHPELGGTCPQHKGDLKQDRYPKISVGKTKNIAK